MLLVNLNMEGDENEDVSNFRHIRENGIFNDALEMAYIGWVMKKTWKNARESG